MNIIKNLVEKNVQSVARKTKHLHGNHETEMKKFDIEVRRRRARQEDYSELIGQQVIA